MLKKITFDDVTVDLFVGDKSVRKDCQLTYGAELSLSTQGKDFIRAIKRNNNYEAEFYICTSQLNFTDAEKYENKINVAAAKQKETIITSQRNRYANGEKI